MPVREKRRLGTAKLWRCRASEVASAFPVETRLAASPGTEARRGETGQAQSLRKEPTPVKAPSLAQQVAERLFHDLATDFGNRRSQRNILRTNLDTVLRVATFLDAAVAHQRRQTLALQRPAGGM